jgi:8-oxoguanine deaminase
VPISTGVDGAASNEAADMISEMHAAWLMQRAAAGDSNQPIYRGGNGEGDSTAVTADDVVASGTSGGARYWAWTP